MDEFLTAAAKASVAGDHTTAKQLFAVLFRPMSDGDLSLGEEEMVSEVLTVDVEVCASRYALAVYMTTPVQERAAASWQVHERTSSLTLAEISLRSMEEASSGPLPDQGAFLPLWIQYLEQKARPGSAWQGPPERMLREAVSRGEGVAGLERLARAAGTCDAFHAWLSAMKDKADWTGVLRAAEEGSQLKSADDARGTFFDQAALAAVQLGRSDVTQRLEAAWRGAPSLARLLRWLMACDPSPETLRKRAASALADSRGHTPRLQAVLHLAVGDVDLAANILATSTGSEWPRRDHPGAILFPALCRLLGAPRDGTIRAQLVKDIQRPPEEYFDLEVPAEASRGPSAPRLSTPSLAAVLDRAGVRLSPEGRVVAVQALIAAAEARTEAVIKEKDRREHEHAASLVAACVEVDRLDSEAFLRRIDQRASRYPAFRQDLGRALGRSPKRRPRQAWR
jgi:hypothetical protein